MNYDDKFWGVALFGITAVAAYACVPKSQFPTPGKRLRTGFIFFVIFVTSGAIYSWDKLSKLWN